MCVKRVVMCVVRRVVECIVRCELCEARSVVMHVVVFYSLLHPFTAFYSGPSYTLTHLLFLIPPGRFSSYR